MSPWERDPTPTNPAGAWESITGIVLSVVDDLGAWIVAHVASDDVHVRSAMHRAIDLVSRGHAIAGIVEGLVRANAREAEMAPQRNAAMALRDEASSLIDAYPAPEEKP